MAAPATLKPVEVALQNRFAVEALARAGDFADRCCRAWLDAGTLRRLRRYIAELEARAEGAGS